MTRTVFKVSFENEWIERIPNYGSDYKRPSKKRCDEHKAEGGDKLFTRHEVLQLLNGAWIEDKIGKRVWVAPSTQMRAMIYLGINCGFGNKDVAALPLKAVDLKERIIRFPRPKTAVKRENPLLAGNDQSN